MSDFKLFLLSRQKWPESLQGKQEQEERGAVTPSASIAGSSSCELGGQCWAPWAPILGQATHRQLLLCWFCLADIYHSLCGSLARETDSVLLAVG